MIDEFIDQSVSNQLRAEHDYERGEILLENAARHQRVGESELAQAIWRDLIAEGGESGDFARIDLAEYLFNAGEGTAARAELAALKATRRTNSGGWNAAAELLEERGELSESLVWYTMATARFASDDVELLDMAMSWPAMLVPTMDEALDWMQARRGTPAEVRMLFWPRSEFADAMTRWPELIDADASQHGYYDGLEVKLAAMVRVGTHGVSIVSCTVDSSASTSTTPARTRRTLPSGGPTWTSATAKATTSRGRPSATSPAGADRRRSTRNAAAGASGDFLVADK